MENSVDGMLCSLLYQILELQPYLVHSISRAGLDPMAKRTYHDWSRKELKETLFCLLRVADSSFCIFLDGLDEAVEKLHRFDIKALLDGLTRLDGVKVCASGRPEPKFAKYFNETEQLAIHDLTGKDIKRLVNSRLKGMQLDSCFRGTLAYLVVSRAQGVFMWVILVLNSVEMSIERETPEECLERVSRMAQDLHALYSDMWSRARYHGIDRTMAALYFSLVIKRRLLSTDSHDSFVFMNPQPVRFVKVHEMPLFELALIADADFLATFFGNYDSVTTTKLVDLIEKAKKRIDLGTAGLLQCVRKADIRHYVSLEAIEKVGTCALDVVDFTHRTVFDFFMNSEYGPDILLESSMTNKEFSTRCLKSVMLRNRYFWAEKLPYKMDKVSINIIPVSPVAEIIIFIREYKTYDPDILAPDNEILKTLWDWNLKGHFENASWASFQGERLTLPNERTVTRLLQLFQASVETYPRMAIGFIQGIGPDEILRALPYVLRSSNETYDYDEWFGLVRQMLSRIGELRDSGSYSRQDELGRDISLALSFFLRKVFFILHEYASQPGKSARVQGVLRNVVKTIEWFTKLGICNHWWDRRFVVSICLDFIRERLNWYMFGYPSQWTILVTFNDMFLKEFLPAQAGLQDIQALEEGETPKPAFNIVYSKFRKPHPVPFQGQEKPSILWVHKMEELLLQTLTGKQSFQSSMDQYKELLEEVEGTDTSMEPAEYRRWVKEIRAQLEDLQHPWMRVNI